MIDTAAQPSRRLRRRPRLNDERGLTLIEVVFTALIVILISSATATALVSTSRAAGDQQFRSEADSLAAQDEDQMRGLSDEQLNTIQAGVQPGQSGQPVRQHQTTLGGITFTVTSGASVRSVSGSAACSAAGGAAYATSSVVTWTEGSLTRRVEVDSMLARPVIGELVVQANDSSGTAVLPGVSVVVTGSSPGSSRQTAQTSGLGCAVFAGLNPDTYTLSATKSGYVAPNGSSAFTSTVPVPSTGASTPVSLGVASGPIHASYRSPAGTTGEANGFSWLLPNGMASPGVSATATSTSGASGNNLYPGSYQIWGGRCPGQQPPSGSAPPPSVNGVTVSPGQSPSPSVSEPTLQVNVIGVLNGQNYPVQPGDVIETYRGGGCIDSWAATVASGSSEPATGWLANPGQPYAASGSLSVCADFNYGGWYQNTVTTSNTSFSSAANANPVTVTINGTTTGQCAVQTS